MKLEDFNIILASGSPRRIKMLNDDRQHFNIIKPDCEENICTALSPEQSVMALALRKAFNVKSSLQTNPDFKSEEGFGLADDISKPLLIIACDTIVAFGGEIIGKPKDEKDAFNILSKLNGNKHQVWSGVCLTAMNNNFHKIPLFTLVFSCKTDVYFKSYSEEDILQYIASGEPMDKAGAYAIQGGFGKYIDHYDGDYNNIVGLPYDDIKAKLLSINSLGYNSFCPR